MNSRYGNFLWKYALYDISDNEMEGNTRKEKSWAS
jgi:hypothetical protein